MQFRQPIRACGSPIIASRGPLPPNPLRNEARRKETFRDLVKTVFLGILSERVEPSPLSILFKLPLRFWLDIAAAFSLPRRPRIHP